MAEVGREVVGREDLGAGIVLVALGRPDLPELGRESLDLGVDDTASVMVCMGVVDDECCGVALPCGIHFKGCQDGM